MELTTNTLSRLKKFIELRNKNEFTTNFAFMSDADLAGLDLKELGKAKPLPHAIRLGDQWSGYYWITSFGILVENYFQLRLFRYSKYIKEKNV